MSRNRSFSQRKPSLDELYYSPKFKDETILKDEKTHSKRLNKLNNDEENVLILENDQKRINRQDIAHVDLIERMILESSSNKQRRRRRSSNSTNNNYSSYQIDKLLQDENNDWFFEKILEKFEGLRSRKVNQDTRALSNDVIYGVERIVERRYYVKKAKVLPKRDQLTSTSDLTNFGKKSRQLSGISNTTDATTCSQCSSTTPTYVENLRDQSDTLRNEISDLKHEIEQLQTSQKQFFQQLQTYLHSRPTAQTSTPSNISSTQTSSQNNRIVEKPSGPITIKQRTPSISTESETSASETTSGTSTPTHDSTKRSNNARSIGTVPRAPPIAEFMANKNPAIAPTPPMNPPISSKPPSIGGASSVTAFTATRNSSIISGPPTGIPAGPGGSRTSSIAPTPPAAPPASAFSSRTSSIAPTPPAAPPAGSFGSRTSSTVPTPPAAPPTGLFGLRTSSTVPTPPAAPSAGSFDSRSSSVAPTPPATAPLGSVTSRTSSAAPTPQTVPPAGSFGSQTSLSASAPAATAPLGSTGSRTASVAPTPPTVPLSGSFGSQTSLSASAPATTAPVGIVGSRTASVAPAPPGNVPGGSVNSRASSVAPASSVVVPIAPTLPTASTPTSAGRIPTYENELAHRRVLSPRSQIVASSASIQESSDSSSESNDEESHNSNTQKNSKVPITILRDNDMKDLERYSSQLELSGFPASTSTVVTNPNNNSNFWESVDQYIENARLTTAYPGFPSTSESPNNYQFGLNSSTTKQLDKYDLEIKPQEFIASSAPLLMPPLDIYHNL